MKKLMILMMLAILTIPMVLSVPIGQYNLIGNQSTPIYTEEKFSPLVFLNKNGGRILFDDPYGIWENGNISDRINNYAFTGEQIKWEVLVWDKNGVPDKINDVFAGWVAQNNGPLDPEKQVNCNLGNQLQDGEDLSRAGYSDVRRPGDQTDQQSFNDDTMGIYECTLTIEPNCHGQKWLGVKAVDVDNKVGTMQEAESWFCNPSMNIEVSGNVNFGDLGPGERGSSTISIKNNAEVNSGMETIFRISGTDFYDPSSSGAICPTSNVLNLGQFSYSATQGSRAVYNQQIPYGTRVTDSSLLLGNPQIATSSGSEISMTLSLELPEPCNGAFVQGSIYLWAVAI